MKQPISIYDGTMTEEDLDPVLATQEQDGLMSKEDKKKLDSMSEGGGGSTPIESIDASKVVQDETHRFVTDTEKTTWNSKAGTDKATGSADGLMAKEDKVKLDAIEAEANKYVHPDSHPASMITEDTDHKFVTETQIASWDAKATGEVATGSKDGLMSKEDKTKLDTVEEGANKYEHPANHEASMIIEDETHRFVTDTEKTTWNTPATKDTVGLGNVTNDAQVKRSEMGVADGVATLDSTGKIPSAQLPSFVDDVIEVNDFETLPEQGEVGKIYVTTTDNKTYRWTGSSYVEIPTSVALGETSSTAYAGDKGKANADEIAKIKDGTTIVPKAGDAATVSGHTVEANVPTDAKFTDTVYTHPDTHDATMINQDSTHKFVTDTQISTWDAKAEVTPVTTEANGLMTKEDKTKLDGIATGANNYTHPENHPATMITEDTDHKFVTDTEKAAWNGKADATLATTEANGLMSSTDKTKLDAIEEGANNYVHPTNHPATMITEDETHRFTTDEEKATWNGKADTIVATTEKDGLMASTDKTKLDGIEANANKYEHPANHPATMITEDETHRFTTDEEKATWNGKADVTPTKPYYDETYGLVACGTAVTIEKSAEESKLDVKWTDVNGQQTLQIPESVNIIGGGIAHKHPSNYPSTSITINSGAIKNVFGAGVGGNVGSVTVVINGGTFATGAASIIAGGIAYDDNASKTCGSDVGTAELIINNTENEVFLVYGGGQGYSTVGKTKVVINGGSFNYLTAGGSNGNTGVGEVVVNGGTINVLQGCNRGTVGNIKLSVNGGTITNVYAGGETSDSNVDATYSKSEVIVTGGTITNISAGKNGKVENADKVTGTYIEGTIEDEKATAMNLTKIPAYKVATTTTDGLMSAKDKAKLDKLKMVMVINNETLAKNATVTTTVSVNTVKYLVILDNDSIPHGHSIPVYKDKTNGKRFVAKIVDLDVAQLAYTEKVFKFEIVDENTLKYLGGMKITTKENTVTTEAIDENTFYILGMSI